ncbi:hypothetical protein FSW04_20315 [Baekduia soli]|uniref:FlgD Ig-like domain-containing protein n=1 Tax=Baekduia soli TaxID=496014 RepID=A0A5B8U954_9ACTN|nr:hypothetical protein [Baekduia soli]QEC49689.1 hypothetical protein FSW04_20315 [Baekduia soli]
MPTPAVLSRAASWALAALLLAAPAAGAAATATAPSPLTLKLDRTVLAAKAGAEVPIAFRVGRAASMVVRIKTGPRTVEILRSSAKAGHGSVTWDGMLGAKAAAAGRYRVAAYAVAADGATARASATLTIAP